MTYKPRGLYCEYSGERFLCYNKTQPFLMMKELILSWFINTDFYWSTPCIFLCHGRWPISHQRWMIAFRIAAEIIIAGMDLIHCLWDGNIHWLILIQYDHHIANKIFKLIFLDQNCCFLIWISMKFVSKGQINHIAVWCLIAASGPFY